MSTASTIGPLPFSEFDVPSSQTMAELIPQPLTVGSWYRTQYGCLRTDPTRIARFHSFPDGMIPRAFPMDPAPLTRVCTFYDTAWAWPTGPSPSPTQAQVAMSAERAHPQFAFNGRGPATRAEIDVESQLRCLDRPQGRCTEPVAAMDSPLFHNTVAPPTPTNVPTGPQNAANPTAAMVRSGSGSGGSGSACRIQADAVATAMSGRFVNNPTRMDTKRFTLPFAPPGIGSGTRRGPGD